MLYRPLSAMLALCLIVLTSGCCPDRWCCRHPFAPRCRPACCPAPSEGCGCCNPCAYPPVESGPPPFHPGPLVPFPPGPSPAPFHPGPPLQ